jgi:hypothetical protein
VFQAAAAPYHAFSYLCLRRPNHEPLRPWTWTASTDGQIWDLPTCARKGKAPGGGGGGAEPEGHSTERAGRGHVQTKAAVATHQAERGPGGGLRAARPVAGARNFFKNTPACCILHTTRGVPQLQDWAGVGRTSAGNAGSHRNGRRVWSLDLRASRTQLRSTNLEQGDATRAGAQSCSMARGLRSPSRRGRRSTEESPAGTRTTYYTVVCSKWRAVIRYDGKQHHLGCFEDEKEAARAYDSAALAPGGE